MNKLDRTDIVGLTALCVTSIAIVLVAFIASLPNEPDGLFDYLTKPDDSLAQWSMALVSIIATGFSVWAVFILRKTFQETQKTTNAAIDTARITQRQLDLAHLPEMKVMYFILSGDKEDDRVLPNLEAGAFIRCKVWVVNSGFGAVKLKSAHCAIYWIKGDELPMVPQYSGTTHRNLPKIVKDLLNDDNFADGDEYPPGKQGMWNIPTTIPQDYGEGTTLCIMGWLLYSGGPEREIYQTFVRKYDPVKARCVHIEEADDYNATL